MQGQSASLVCSLLALKWVDCRIEPHKQFGQARAQKPETRGSMKQEQSYEINTLLCFVKKISDKPVPKFC